MTEINIKGERYEVLSDLHTHTRYSHGKGTIEDNVRAAAEKGLKTIGISDHGPGHIGFGVPRKRLAEMKAEIIRLRREYPDIEILFGVEANIIVPGGKMDVKPDETEFFDFICAGWHFGAVDGLTPKGIANTFMNFARGTYKKATKKQIKYNTDAIVAAIETGRVKFLTHPGQRAPVDLIKVAKACSRTGTLLEINTSHMSLSVSDLKYLIPGDVNFIITSDAHKPGRIGDFQPAERLLNESDIDPGRIENLKKI